MFTSTKKYNLLSQELCDVKDEKHKLCIENKKLTARVEKLNEEIKKLGEVISASNKECNVGPWCKDCAHIRHDNYGLKTYSVRGRGYYYENPGEDEVMYCVKHLHDLCPEHSVHDAVITAEKEEPK